MIVAGVWTRVGFSNLKNCRSRIQNQKFWNRSGIGVWKIDSGHLCMACEVCWRLAQHLATLPLMMVSKLWRIRGGTGSGLSESTPAGFCVVLSDPDLDLESKIYEKLDPESLFNFGSSRSLCGHFLSKNMGKLRWDGWLQPETEQESDSQIWRITGPGSGPGFKNFGTGTESEKVTLATSVAYAKWKYSV